MWLGLAILLASVAGCIAMMVLVDNAQERPLTTAPAEVFGVPLGTPVAVAEGEGGLSAQTRHPPGAHSAHSAVEQVPRRP